MENIIRCNNYTQTERERLSKLSIDADTLCEGLLDLSFQEKFFSQIPKIMDTTKHQIFTRLFDQCDSIARRRHGRVEGNIDFQLWHARITLTLPFLDFTNCELSLLRDFADHASLVSFFPVPKKQQISMEIQFPIFEDLDIDEITAEAIFQSTKKFFENQGYCFDKWSTLETFWSESPQGIQNAAAYESARLFPSQLR